MAKVGDRYIITIDSKMTNHNGNLYTASGMRTLVFDDEGLSKLIPFKGDASYGRGMFDMYEAIKAMLDMGSVEFNNLFHTDDIQNVFKIYKPLEIINMIDVYRMKQKLNYSKFNRLASEIGEEGLKQIIHDFLEREKTNG